MRARSRSCHTASQPRLIAATWIAARHGRSLKRQRQRSRGCPLRLCGPTQFGRARALPCYGAPMRGFGLSRWQQIATVLSILWAIGAWFYTINSFERDAKLISERMYDDCVVHRSETAEDCYNIMKQTHHVQMALGRKQAAARALLPIPLAWIAIWLLNRTVRWITST